MAPPGPMIRKRPSPAAVSVVESSESSDSFASPSTTVPSSPASFDSDHRTFSISSLKGRKWRSFSSREREAGSDRSYSFRTQARRLSRSRPLSSASHIDVTSRRGSAVSALSDDHGRLSLSIASNSDSASLANICASASSSSIDWEAQRVEGCAPLESDTGLLKTRTPYLVVTTKYLVKTKSRTDAQALFPELAPERGKHEARKPTAEPLLAIPMDAIVSAFAAESTRPSFGIEVWWKNPLAGHAFCRSDFFFTSPSQRNEQMHHVTRAMRASQQDETAALGQWQDVRTLLEGIYRADEPRSHHRKPDIFPVVPRGATRREYMPKLEDATKKPQEGPAFYLVVGTYLCHLVEVQKGKGGDAVCRNRTFGLVTLESFKGEWILHEERFNITFRDPFEQPVTLELASRYYRQVIRVFGTADRYLKPAWPQLWQTMEIFRVSGLKEPQYLVPKEDFGSFKRTLDAYLAAYRCDDVDWEINWRTRYAPEFRLLPGKRGPYTPLQLLAVLRALRYNDYFTSLSFRDVDLSVLYGLQDSSLRKANVAYLSRTCVALGHDEIEMLRVTPTLHQEFHALAFCSETIRQIDFTNCSSSLSAQLALDKSQVLSLQFLAPILSLLRSGITKCNRLIVSGNILPPSDVDDLAGTMKSGAIQALDVSYCGLDDASLRDMIVAPLSEYPGLLQSLSISGNPGRLPAHVLPGLFCYLTEIRELNLSGSIQAESYVTESLLPFAALECMERLEELDVSGYKLDEATFCDLERFLQYRSWRLEQGQPMRFHKLVLNHCGVTGVLAARLFDAIGQDRGMTLCLSGNPIEEGIDYLAASIRAHKGPAALYLEMIEFKHESGYLTLLQALTAAAHISLVSLAGTAPSPSSHGPCSDELVTTLHDFFARNTSIRCLDLSGFSGKLDDGQLPKGFGRALAGLAANATLTHLRIRNQNLHDDAGVLGHALAENTALVAVDCRDNNLNLTSLRFLVDSLAANTSIRDFPLAHRAERAAVWKNVLRGLQRAPPALGTAAATATATASSAASACPAAVRDLQREEEKLLREVLERTFATLEAKLRENRARARAAPQPGANGGTTPQAGAGTSMGRSPSGHSHPHRHRHQRSSSSSGGNLGIFPRELADEDEDEACWPGFEINAITHAGPSRSSSTDSEPARAPPRPTVRSAALQLQEQERHEQAEHQEQQQQQQQEEEEGYDQQHEYEKTSRHPLPAPLPLPHYLVSGSSGLRYSGQGVVAGMESPTETLDPVSEVETPAEEKDELGLGLTKKGQAPRNGQGLVRVVNGEAGAEAEVEVEAGRRAPGDGGEPQAQAEVEDEEFRKMVEDFRRAGFEV